MSDDVRPREDVLASTDAGPAAIRGGVLRVAGYAAGTILSVGSAILLFRHLGVEGSGDYFRVIALVAIVGGLTDAGLTAIGVRELSVREGPGRDRVLRDLLGLRIVLTTLGIGGAVLFAAVAYDGDLALGTLLAGIGLLLANLSATLAIALMSGLRLGWVTALDLLRQVATVAALVALIVADAGTVTLLAATIPAGLVALIATVLVVREGAPVRPGADVAAWRVLLRDTLPYAVATAVGALYFRLALILTSLVGTDRDTGLLSAGFRIVDVLIVVPQLAAGAAFPILARAARDDEARLAYGLDRTFQALLIAGVAVALVLGLGAPVVLDIVAGPEFSEADDVLRIQAAGLAASFVAAAWGYTLLSLRMHRALLTMNLAALAVSAGLTLALVPSAGAEGAAIATTAAEVVLIGVGAFLLFRARPQLRPAPAVIPKVAVAAAAALVAGFLPPLAAAAVGLLIYLVVLLALRAFPPELLVELRRLRAS